MDEKEKNDELQSRREFFKKAVSKTLPLLTGVYLFPTLTSCNKEDEELNGGGSSNSNTISDATGKIGNYEYVDLGLSVKWARYNFGSSKPEGKGSLISLNELPYRYSASSVVGTSYDMARKKWGEKWQMPSKANFEELISKCTYKLIAYNGVEGLRFQAKNGNSIFLPIAGGTDLNEKFNNWGFYWTGTAFKYTDGTVGYNRFVFYMSPIGTGLEVSTKDYSNNDERSSLRPVTTNSSTNTSCSGSSCSANCQNNSNNSGCSSCASSCSTSCKTECEYNCAATCVNHCGGSCNDSCGGTCTYLSAGTGCSGCARSCYNRCYTSCNYACSDNCESSCVHGSK